MIQGPGSVQRSPLCNYPKCMGTNRFPSLMKLKLFGQDSYRIADPTLQLHPPPIDPLFGRFLSKGLYILLPIMSRCHTWKLRRSLLEQVFTLPLNADMFLYEILSALKSPAPSQSDLSEVRRHLEALANLMCIYSMYWFDWQVVHYLSERDAFLDKCALASTMKASLRVQPLESSTLFGPKIPEVSKCSREDLKGDLCKEQHLSHYLR